MVVGLWASQVSGLGPMELLAAPRLPVVVRLWGSSVSGPGPTGSSAGSLSWPNFQKVEDLKKKSDPIDRDFEPQGRFLSFCVLLATRLGTKMEATTFCLGDFQGV